MTSKEKYDIVVGIVDRILTYGVAIAAVVIIAKTFAQF